MRMRAVSGLSLLLLAVVAVAAAQIVPIKTLPLAQGDQFVIFPSNNLGMAGVAIALADTLFDPFRNPAAGVRVGAMRLLTSPTAYGTSQGAGAGRTLPFAALGGSRSWFGGLGVALQQVDAVQSAPGVFNPVPLAQSFAALSPPAQSHGNEYAFASLGKVLARSHVALGASVAWSGLRDVDGVELLYPQSVRVDQSGHTMDVRLGLVKDWPGERSVEALLLRQGNALAHDVTYLDQVWDPTLQQTVQQLRVERNRDRSATWGADVRYRRPLAASGWKIGGLLTVNRVTNDQVPDYDVLGLPQGAGRSTAADVGVGFSRTQGPATFGIDALYEPIVSAMWSLATAPAVTASGDTLAPGARTLDNRYRFSNAVLRMGVGRTAALPGVGKVAGFQLGLALRAVHYRLTQQDYVQATTQHMSQSWLEWTPTWGLSLRFPELELRYAGRVTNGMGRTGQFQVFFPPGVRVGGVGLPGFFVTPGGPLQLTGVHTVTHQISLSLPL